MDQIAPKKGKLGLIRSLGLLLERTSLFGGLGKTHGGDRDLWAAFGYKLQLSPVDLYAKYRRQDVAKTIVEAPADAIWTLPPELRGNEGFQKAWKELEKKHSIWQVLNRADKCCGWGRFSIVIIGMNDASDLAQPLSPGRPGREITYLQPYSELALRISKFIENKTDPRFGQPLEYEVAPTMSSIEATNRVVPGTFASSFKVHWSRVLHVANDIMEDGVYGIPKLEPVYNLLDDLLKVGGGTAETYWLTANRGLQLNIDKDMKLNEADAEALADEVEEYQHQLRRVLRTRGVEVKELGGFVPDPSRSFDVLTNLISAAARIPKRILFGSEAGQLASEQDRANWAERITERRTKWAEPYVIKPMIERFTEIGFLPKPGPDFEMVWPDPFLLSPLERAQTSAQKARSAVNLAKTMTEQPEFLDIDECRKIVALGDIQEVVVKGAPTQKDTGTRKIREVPKTAPGGGGGGQPRLPNEGGQGTGESTQNE